MNFVFWIAFNLELSIHSAHHNCFLDTFFFLFGEGQFFEDWFHDHQLLTLNIGLLLSCLTLIRIPVIELFSKTILLGWLFLNLPIQYIADPTQAM